MKDDFVADIVLFRLAERGVLTVFVLISCIILIRLYLGKVTKFAFESEKLSVSAVSVAIATPVLIFSIFVGYAYVSLSNRIEIGLPPSSAIAASATEPRHPENDRKGVKERESTKEGTQSPFEFRGLHDDDSRPAGGVGEAQKTRQSEVEAKLVFAASAERNLRLVFTSLVAKVTPLTPVDANRILNLALAITCLDSEQPQLILSFDSLAAGKNFEEIRKYIVEKLNVVEFKSKICASLKLEL